MRSCGGHGSGAGSLSWSTPAARALTWLQIAVHHQWIDDQLAVPVTVATIAQRLRDDHGVEVSESTVRRYIATTFTEQRLEDRVTVPRGAVEPVVKPISTTAASACGATPWPRR
jgi:hypothetical protein